MPEDRFTTLPSGGFSVETQISDNKGWDRASFVSYLDPIQPSAPPTNHLTIYQRGAGQATLTASPSSLGGEGSYSGCLHWQGEVRPSDRRCRHKSQSGEVALAATPQYLARVYLQSGILTSFRDFLTFAQPSLIIICACMTSEFTQSLHPLLNEFSPPTSTLVKLNKLNLSGLAKSS